jgi:hypothetical protein
MEKKRERMQGEKKEKMAVFVDMDVDASRKLTRWSILNWRRHHKPLHEHFRQFPDFFKVLPPTGPAR